MSIKTMNGFLTNGSTFSDVIQDTDFDTEWYKIWDEETGIYYTEGAGDPDDNWVSADSLSQMDLPYDENNFYVKSWDPDNGQSGWMDFRVSIGNEDSTVELTNENFNANTSISYDRVINASNLDSDAYLRIYNANESKYLDEFGDGWIKADELDDYTFNTGADGETNQIWVDTWMSGDGRSGWEDVKVSAAGGKNDYQDITIKDVAGTYELIGFVANPYYGHITEEDVSNYHGNLNINEDGDYSLNAEASYQGVNYWTAGEGYITDVDEETFSAFSYYDGHVELDYALSGDTLVFTLGDGFSGDEYIQTFEFEYVDADVCLQGVNEVQNDQAMSGVESL